jgi:hypothetical protein
MNRRSFLGGLIAAPAIVSFNSIMPVRLPSILTPIPRRNGYIELIYDGTNWQAYEAEILDLIWRKSVSLVKWDQCA